MTIERDLECRLRDVLAPLAEVAGYEMTEQPWISGFGDWRYGWTATPRLLAALCKAQPFPDHLAAVWAEYRGWQMLQENRSVEELGYKLPPHVAARMAGLEFLMDTMADATVEGLRARFAWLDHLSKLDTYRTNSEDSQLARRMAADFEEFATTVQIGQMPGVPVPASPVRRTQAERRREVMSILSSEPELADREIARRAGVSPQTVSTWRRKSPPSG